MFDDPTALVTNAQFDTPGTYVLRLVTGGGQQIASDDVVINVENSGVSDSPLGHWTLDTIHLSTSPQSRP